MMILSEIEEFTGLDSLTIIEAYNNNEFELNLPSVVKWYKQKVEETTKNSLTNLNKYVNMDLTPDQVKLTEQINKWSERLVVAKRD